MENYLIRITGEEQIPGVVYETRSRAVKGPVGVLLVHEERPNVVRGRFQPLEHHDGIPEVRRPDGGLSWYHAGTFCYMRGEPTTGAKNTAEAQELWGGVIIDLLRAFGYTEPLQYMNSDVYLPDGRQIVGMSGWLSQERRVLTKVQRACWYERDPMNDISDLLRADGIVPEKFASKIEMINPGFFEYLVEQCNPVEVDACAFVSRNSMARAYSLQHKKGGTLKGSCVLGSQNI